MHIFHNWSKWSKPYGRVWQFQTRACSKCGKVQERLV